MFSILLFYITIILYYYFSIRSIIFCFLLIKFVSYIKEFRTPTEITNPIHNETAENRIFLLPDQPSGKAKAIGTPISNRKEIAINANIVS